MGGCVDHPCDRSGQCDTQLYARIPGLGGGQRVETAACTARVLVVHTSRPIARPPETEFARGVRPFGDLLMRVMVVIVRRCRKWQADLWQHNEIHRTNSTAQIPAGDARALARVGTTGFVGRGPDLRVIDICVLRLDEVLGKVILSKSRGFALGSSKNTVGHSRSSRCAG